MLASSLLGACTSVATRMSSANNSVPGSPVSPVAGQEWEKVIAAAQQEGEVVVYGPPGSKYRMALVDAFERAFPGIKVTYTGLTGSDIGPRIIAERQAGRFIPDVHIGGPTTINALLKPAGAIDPIPPLLIRPDVVDTSKWFQNKLWYADNEGQFNLIFEGGAGLQIVVNKNVIDPNVFSSYWDILDVKYRGKIAANDVRKPGPGDGQIMFIWVTESLGSSFLEKLFGEMQIVLTDDRRQLIDWIAQGQYWIGLFPGDEAEEAIKQGLPISYVDVRKMKEGFYLSSGYGTIAVMNNRPHPNAAIVYINWLLSPEGQLAYQKAGGWNSLRVDIPKNMVNPLRIPPSNAQAIFINVEKYQQQDLRQIRDVIIRAFERR